MRPIKTGPLCRHCRKNQRAKDRRRGLCRSCANDPAIRELYLCRRTVGRPVSGGKFDLAARVRQFNTIADQLKPRGDAEAIVEVGGKRVVVRETLAPTAIPESAVIGAKNGTTLPGENLAERVRLLRAEKGLSLTELAEVADVGRRTIVRIETGAYVCSLSTLQALAEALDVEPARLVG